MSSKTTTHDSGKRKQEQTAAVGGEVHQIAGGEHPVLTTNQGVAVSDNQNSLRAQSARADAAARTSSCARRSRISTTSAFPSVSSTPAGPASHGFFELTDLAEAIHHRQDTHRSRREDSRVHALLDRRRAARVRSIRRATCADLPSSSTPRKATGTWSATTSPSSSSRTRSSSPTSFTPSRWSRTAASRKSASAHDTFWDFISLTPESMHMVMWVMSDRTIPRSLRMIEGFGVHSFRLINDAGESTFVKFHWRPKLGLQSTVWDEAVKIAGADPDFHRRDMFEAIPAGGFPEWEFAVQLFTEEQADSFPFDHLDATKLIPEELVPLRVIGRMVLDRWPNNFFAETEQVAYCPAHIVPGIDFSNDPLLQGRLLSYEDTQLSRLGSPNFHQIPINAPKCPIDNQQRDGHMQIAQPEGRVSYEPNSLSADSPRESPAAGFHSAAVAESGEKGRIRAESFADHYSQARQFYLQPDRVRAGAHRVRAGVRTVQGRARARARGDGRPPAAHR